MARATYVALLRGINVGGQKMVKMDALRASLEALGLEGVRTYVQSGNVVFQASKRSCATLAQKIEARLLRDFGFAVKVLVKSADEIRQTAKSNPFLKQKGIDTSKLHVTFLSRAPEKAALKALEALTAKPEQFRSSRTEVYLYCPNGYGKTKLSNNALEKVLAVSATTRNWNTVTKLLELSSE